MKALDYGLLPDALDLKMVADAATVNVKGSSAALVLQDVIVDSVQKHLKECLERIEDKKESRKCANGKNVVELRKKLLKNFWKDRMSFKAKKCAHCGAPKRNVKIEYNSKIYLKALSTRQASQWEAVSRVSKSGENTPVPPVERQRRSSGAFEEEEGDSEDDDESREDDSNGKEVFII